MNLLTITNTGIDGGKGIKELRYVATVPTACGIETNFNNVFIIYCYVLQQHLPLAVLKHIQTVTIKVCIHTSCNSTYRLWYATKGAGQQRSETTMRTAHL